MSQEYYAPDFSIKISGLTMAADVSDAVTDLSYESNSDAADMFRLTLNNADLSLTDSALFDVGKKVEIHMGYTGDLQAMMLGEITAVTPSFPAGGSPTLAITGYDLSHRLRHNRPERFTFKYMNDSAIAAIIAAENLLIPIVDPAPTLPRESVQQTGSDWAFLTELATRNFFSVRVDWDKLLFQFPRPQLSQVVLEWGKNLSSFSPRLSNSGQFGIAVIRGYDYKLAQKIVSILPAVAVGEDIDNIIEKLGSAVIDQLVSLGRYVVRDKNVSNYVDAAQLAKSLLVQLLKGMYEGTGNCIGIPELRAGKTIQIRGVGKRFGGTYTLTKVTHSINASGYQTSFEISQQFESSFLGRLRKKIGDSPNPNQQEPVRGPVVGVVENNVDPELLGRVQLSFPTLSDTNLSDWARIVSAGAGSDRGNYFIPEIGDEVLVMFEGGDIDKPLVMGGLWNGTARPPLTNQGINAKKSIKTRSGMFIEFDDTPGNESIQLRDRAGSTITMQSSTGDIVIEAINNVTIRSGPTGFVDLN
jgi:phage protein D/phage baseplate assembly protein gpV